MAVGDQNDMAARLRAVLPGGWFADADSTPVLSGLLAGLGSVLAQVFGLLGYVQLQTRLLTATDGFVDLAAQDFLGFTVVRRPNESDYGFALRIQHEVLRPRLTRAAIIEACQDLTGNTPALFEPSNIRDTGAWDEGAFGWDSGGGWGDLNCPFQIFVTIERGTAPDIGALQAATLGKPSGWDEPLGGWDEGAFAWSALSIGGVTDTQIYAAIAGVMASGCTAWVRIVNGAPLVLGAGALGQARII
jgi:hypothetical protein